MDTMYCRYCYKDQPVELGADGSIIVCTVCGNGLAGVPASAAAESSEQIDMLAESAALIDQGAALARQAAREHPSLREDAWLAFKEAELRMVLSGMRNVRDNVAANIPFMEDMRRALHEQGDI